MDLKDYIADLKEGLGQIQASDKNGKQLGPQQAIDIVTKNIVKQTSSGKKVMFIGNGGSASIASHMAVDFWKNGLMRALSFNDPAQLTCLSNDLGYERVFSRPVEMFAEKKDILIAISSSGKSINILNAVKSGHKKQCWTLTLSGFRPDNPLRRLGDINIYVPRSSYGIVEIAHLAICHYILDNIMGL